MVWFIKDVYGTPICKECHMELEKPIDLCTATYEEDGKEWCVCSSCQSDILSRMYERECEKNG